MGHTHDDMLNIIFSSDFDHFAQGRSEGIETLNTESLEVSKFSDEEINKALIPAESFESTNSFLLGWLKDLEVFDSSFNKRFQEIYFLFTSQMHILITNFIHIGISKVVLHSLNSIWPVFLI